MIDINSETLIPLGNVPAIYEELTGRRPNISTIHRHRLRGIRGVKLNTTLIGGLRYTTISVLETFFRESTAAADHVRIPKSREPISESLSAAERALEQDGI